MAAERASRLGSSVIAGVPAAIARSSSARLLTATAPWPAGKAIGVSCFLQSAVGDRHHFHPRHQRRHLGHKAPGHRPSPIHAHPHRAPLAFALAQGGVDKDHPGQAIWLNATPPPLLLGVELVGQLVARGLHIGPVDWLILSDSSLQPAALR